MKSSATGSFTTRATLLFCLAALATEISAAQPTTPPPWVERSNRNAQLMLQMQSRFAPEFVAFAGLQEFDQEIFDLKPRLAERSIEATQKVVDELRKSLAAEKDAAVRQDLEIMIQQGEQGIEGVRLSQKLQVPYFDLPQTIFAGIRSLLDEQVAADRRPKALVRLRKYAGVQPGYTPIAELARDRIRERLARPGLLGPFKGEVEKDLANGASFVDGIGKLFEKYGIEGYAEPYAKLRQQLAEYEQFVRREILPRARTDFRQPEELYAYSLKQTGVDMPVAELVSRAQVAFREIQNEMQALAPLVAKQKGLAATDYRDVIAALKREQISGNAILPLYEKRIAELERLIVEKGVITLPKRKMRIRLASEAESAATPAPNMRPPRLIGNTGEMGEFVLPLKIPGKTGGEAVSFDDFTFDAASWTLAVHEGRPGHELQFASLVERGVSVARALYAFNSVNAEGWGLYAEAEMKPYMPLDGQLISLQHRLMRAARAFLDPGLQLGRVTREEATRVLREDVVLSDAMTQQEVERYTFRAPGQATSYFCGYTRLMELRTEAERILGSRFDRREFHDFILAQGLLPPALLRKAVMEDLIARKKAA